MAPDLPKVVPHQYARIYHPLYLKSLLLGLPPIQFVGGQGIELYKFSGDVSDILNYRDVHVSTTPGGVFASCLRAPLKDRVQAASAQTQFGGGLNFGGADLTHLAARASLDVAVAANLSCILLFGQEVWIWHGIPERIMKVAASHVGEMRLLEIVHSTADKHRVCLECLVILATGRPWVHPWFL